MRTVIHRLLEILETRLGVQVFFEGDTFHILTGDELRVITLLQKLQSEHRLHPIVRNTIGLSTLPIHSYNARIITSYEKGATVGGASTQSRNSALSALLAEAVERYVWLEKRDYFVDQRSASTSELPEHAVYVPPERFVSFSLEQRRENRAWELPREQTYLWIRGVSLLNETSIYVPAQTVSATILLGIGERKEPYIRQNTTNGLATWPTQVGARLRGMLELIEREAYMVMWMNQLTLPRIYLPSLRGMSSTLDILLDACEKDELRVHVIRMITDAPTHAICVALEDTGKAAATRFSFGLKAHQSITGAVEKAITEALRARAGTRMRLRDSEKRVWNVDTIGHRERLLYWADPENAPKLSFLIAGTEEAYSNAVWNTDTDDEHYMRLIVWCKEKHFECVSVSLGTSEANITPWHIEMIVMPDLHPMHLDEKFRHLNTKRLHEVPRLCGYSARSTPYTDAPHPFS